MIKDPKPNLSPTTMLSNLMYQANVVQKLIDALDVEKEKYKNMTAEYQKYI